MKISPQSLELLEFKYRTVFVPTIEEKSLWNSLQINADKLTSEIFVYFPQSSKLRYSAELVNMFWFINMCTCTKTKMNRGQ